MTGQNCSNAGQIQTVSAPPAPQVLDRVAGRRLAPSMSPRTGPSVRDAAAMAPGLGGPVRGASQRRDISLINCVHSLTSLVCTGLGGQVNRRFVRGNSHLASVNKVVNKVAPRLRLVYASVTPGVWSRRPGARRDMSLIGCVHLSTLPAHTGRRLGGARRDVTEIWKGIQIYT